MRPELEEILNRLSLMNQPHLAQGLETLSQSQQEAFLKELQPNLLQQQRTIFQSTSPRSNLEPVTHADLTSDQSIPLGLEKLSQQKVACLILAGGQGSRLVGSSLPKALIPVTENKTLLELQLEKIKNTPCAIITSPSNHSQIADFLKKTPFTPTLIQQNESPFLDEEQNWFLKAPGQIASGPDGNGHVLHLLNTSGILSEWQKQNIEIITVIPIDNVLANPIDPILIGYHTGDITLKVIQKKTPAEKMGILVYKEGLIAVQEYSELAENQQGSLAHTGLFALSLPFAEYITQFELPWHCAHKQDPFSKKWIWKFERFLFDILEHSQKTNLLLYPREATYAPIKDDKSLATVRLALQNGDTENR
jgi:UDP-N-acetylglucosamine/UDP-N-acetylgalactosamine diphosphorylase